MHTVDVHSKFHIGVAINRRQRSRQDGDGSGARHWLVCEFECERGAGMRGHLR